jgi:hypothetical protein
VQHQEIREASVAVFSSADDAAVPQQGRSQGRAGAGHADPPTGSPLRSDLCRLAHLLDPVYQVTGKDRQALSLGTGWTTRWLAQMKTAGRKVTWPVKDLSDFPAACMQPVRPFSWRTNQHHRPGLAYMVSTGRHHGHESIAEKNLLLALDFAGDATEVVSQPMKMMFYASGSKGEHTPDFLVTTRSGTLLIDVRPAGLIKEEDRVRFAAAAEVALACGWYYVVAAGWKRQVMATIQALSAQRRHLDDPLGIQDQILREAARGPCRYLRLVEATSHPAIGRAHAVHLLWHRRLGIDLSAPLTDQAMTWAGERGLAC